MPLDSVTGTLVEVSVRAGGCVGDGDSVGLGDEQVHDTVSEFTPPDPEKVNVSFLQGAGRSIPNSARLETGFQFAV